MSGLPSFFQHHGTTVLDELADYELGGTLEEGDDEVIDNEAFGDIDTFGENSETELPSFFQKSSGYEDHNQPDIGSASAHDHFPAPKLESVDLSNLLNNFEWLRKGTCCLFFAYL